MLGSNYDGERASAALLASRAEGGRSRLGVVVIPQTIPAPRREEPPRPDPTDPFAGRSWRDIATRCCECTTLIDQWETDFLEGLGRFPRLSQKQTAKLNEIARRLRAMGCRI
jgi:hypothetical protein